MAKKDPYGVDRDLKVLSGSSGKHSARLEGQFLGIFPSPEVFPEGESERKDERAQVITGVKDPTIRIDLKVGDVNKDPGVFSEMLRMIGLDPREGDFEVLSTLDKVLRALAKARFKNLAELRFNGELVYDHPEEEWDLRSVLGTMKKMATNMKLDEAQARIILREEGDTEAHVTVDKVHTELTHDIYLEFKGELSGEMLRRVINYLEEHLEIEELIRS
ncbi:MAG: hypothetical protein JW939_07680 [Candidatus Thermoplasmatota archaeon]|nr:hypothetical protein [Candidatus Thermoplasmatota archaeon]